MQDIVKMILEKSGKNISSIAIKKFGTRREVLYTELIHSLLKTNSLLEASVLLNISEPTLESQMYKHVKKDFPDKKSNQKWKHFFLSRISYRQCNKCEFIGDDNTYFYSTVNNVCRKCSKNQSLAYREEHREDLKEAAKVYREDNKEKLHAYYNSPEYKLKKAEYRKNNPGIIKAGNAKRREAEINATRKYEYGDQEEIDIIEFYNNCPEGYHVDHIIPLQHRLVCGLHNISNLQYLKAKENLSKGNKFYIE